MMVRKPQVSADASARVIRRSVMLFQRSCCFLRRCRLLPVCCPTPEALPVPNLLHAKQFRPPPKARSGVDGHRAGSVGVTVPDRWYRWYRLRMACGWHTRCRPGPPKLTASPATPPHQNPSEQPSDQKETKMRKVIVTEWMSLDGVVQAPGAPDEDTTGASPTAAGTYPTSTTCPSSGWSRL